MTGSSDHNRSIQLFQIEPVLDLWCLNLSVQEVLIWSNKINIILKNEGLTTVFIKLIPTGNKKRQNLDNKGLESEGQRLKHVIQDSNNSVLMKRKH